MRKRFFLIVSLLVVQGCEKRGEIYSRFLLAERPEVACVDFNRSLPYAPVLDTAFHETGTEPREGCPYTVTVFKNFASCSASRGPTASRGFMRLELSRNAAVLYQVQREFYDEHDDELIGSLVERMATDLSPVSR